MAGVIVFFLHGGGQVHAEPTDWRIAFAVCIALLIASSLVSRIIVKSPAR